MALFLVSGGCCFKSSNSTHARAARDEQIRIVDNPTRECTANRHKLCSAQKSQLGRYRSVIVDDFLLDRTTHSANDGQNDAALPPVPSGEEHLRGGDHVNLDTTRQVLKAAREHKSTPRMIFDHVEMQTGAPR